MQNEIRTEEDFCVALDELIKRGFKIPEGKIPIEDVQALLHVYKNDSLAEGRFKIIVEMLEEFPELRVRIAEYLREECGA